MEDFLYQHLNNTLIKYESILIRFGSWVEEHLNWALHCTFYKRCDWKEERTENNMLKMDSHQNCILHVQLTDIWLFMNKTKQLSYNWCHCVFQTPLVAKTEMEVDDSQQGTGNDPSRNRQLWVQGLAWPKHWKDQVQVLDRESQTHIFKSCMCFKSTMSGLFCQLCFTFSVGFLKWLLSEGLEEPFGIPESCRRSMVFWNFFCT